MPRRRRRGSRRPRGTSVRVTRTKGSGANQTSSHSSGGISITGMGPTGRVSTSRPTIRATVRDQSTSLSESDIKLYLDGSEKSRVRYDPSSGSLSYYVGSALPSGTHEVRIEAESGPSGDQAQFSGKASRRWTFTVARR